MINDWYSMTGWDGDETEFSVEVEHVPVGLYPLIVGGVQRGEIEVVESEGKFKGKLKFTDPWHTDRNAYTIICSNSIANTPIQIQFESDVLMHPAVATSCHRMPAEYPTVLGFGWGKW